MRKIVESSKLWREWAGTAALAHKRVVHESWLAPRRQQSNRKISFLILCRKERGNSQIASLEPKAITWTLKTCEGILKLRKQMENSRRRWSCCPSLPNFVIFYYFLVLFFPFFQVSFLMGYLYYISIMLG